MSPIQFKFIEREGTVRVASFPDPPIWEVLSERIEQLYGIPAADVGISYFDADGYVDYNKSYELRKVTQKNRDEITINTNEELQAYYTTIPPVHNTPLKFAVKNIRSNQRRRPPTDILVDIDDSWTPIFSAVPLTPSRMREAEARIEEIVDSEGEQNQNKAGGVDDDALNIPHEDDEDDASSIDSILENDLPNKKPIHVYRYSGEFQKEPSFRSVSRSSSKTGSGAESRSMSSTEEDRNPESPVILPVQEQQPRIPSLRNSGYEFTYNTPPAESRLAGPVQDRPRSRSRSPAPRSPFVAAREMPMDRSSRRSSRTVSERPSPVIPTIETASPRGFPASVDMNSIPSPEPISVPVPTFPKESLLLEEKSMLAPDPPLPIIPSRERPGTAANVATTPSLTNDIASLLDALTQAFNEHPELSEGLRNIVRNASQGVYWNNATDAIQNIRNSVVNDALEARQVIFNQSTERDVSGRAQAEAGRKIAEALGNVFRSLGTILGSDSSSAPTSASESRSAAPSVPAPAPTAPETLAVPHAQEQRGEDDFLPNPRAGSPALIKATPLIRGQDFPSSDAQSLSRSSSRTPSPVNDRDPNVYPDGGGIRVSSHRSRKIAYPAPQYVPFVWGPPPTGRNGDRNPYGPPTPVVVPPYVYSRHRHHRSHSGTGGSAYPPPPGPPPSGQYYMSPYPTPPYPYSRYPPPPPDSRMYPGAGDYGREYGRDGYPGIGAGSNVRRSNTLPPHFSSPISSVSPRVVQPTAPSDIPRASQPSPRPSLVSAAPIIPPVAPAPEPAPAPVVIVPPQPSVSASNPETPQSSAVVVSSPRSIDDKFAELEEAKRLYKEKKEEWRREREERRIQREKERAERHAKRQGRLPAPPGSAPAPVPPAHPPAINSPGFSVPPASSNARRNDSDDDSGTERAFPPVQHGASGHIAPTSPGSSQRLYEEVFERLNLMGFTIRSYPQLNTLVPLNIRKHTLMNKKEVPDEVVIQQVLDDIFTAPITNKI